MTDKAAQTTTFNDGIIAIDTEYARSRQDASHLIIEGGRAAFVDTGVNSSVPLLVDALQQNNLDVADVDFVFLTHVHLDHAGGAGLLMQQLPNARCVVHQFGAPHMIDPTKLVAGTQAVYGAEKTAAIYGDIVPIDEQRMVVPDDGQWIELHGRPMQTIHTEGHARHHYVLHDPQSKSVFSGDSFGVSYRELDTARGEIVFPTTTPVQFDPGQAHIAADRIMACEPEQVFLTHYSRVGNLQRLASEMHAGIDAYVAMAREHAENADRATAIRESMFEYYLRRLAEHGYAGDRETAWSVLSIDVDLNTQGLEFWLDKHVTKRHWSRQEP
ncbi:MAG: MBL fold metallo-hydrolase [Gammaproteobacteria bacterium]|nr:MBL fold metallo-hydrolase [Gammaproteobacteria bacterium]